MTLTINNLRLLRGRKIVLDGFSAHLSAGQGAWLLGPNGSGKSSLLRAIAGLLPPLQGAVVYSDDFIYLGTAHGHDAALSAQCNLLFWAAQLAPFAVMAPTVASAAALAAAGLASQAEVPAGQLSAGQQQRLALARLLLRPAKLWLLDEPTSALDAAGQAWLAVQLQQQLARGGMVVCATHAPLAAPSLATWHLCGGDA